MTGPFLVLRLNRRHPAYGILKSVAQKTLLLHEMQREKLLVLLAHLGVSLVSTGR